MREKKKRRKTMAKGLSEVLEQRIILERVVSQLVNSFVKETGVKIADITLHEVKPKLSKGWEYKADITLNI